MSVAMLIGLLVLGPIAITIIVSVVRLIAAGVLFLINDYESDEEYERRTGQ